MRCLFCKRPSDASVSREHVIPESLGNVDRVLPPGIVCDGCNNYLSREVEAPFLNSALLREQRLGMAVPSKKGRVPSLDAIVLPAVHVRLASTEGRSVGIDPVGSDAAAEFERLLAERGRFTMVRPAATWPHDMILARFVGKVAIEAMALKVLGARLPLDELIENETLDFLRNFVRRGQTREPWPVGRRVLYDAESLFRDGDAHFEVLHEFTFLLVGENEYYFILAIFGVEYVINIGGPSLDGYERWLLENAFRSPLHADAGS